MSASVPWSVSAVDPDTWDAAREAARREGLSVGEWLEAAIRENARGGHGRGRNPATNFDHRLDDLAEQINLLARRNVYSRPNPPLQPQPAMRDLGAEQITSSIETLTERIDQMLEGMERAQRNNGRDEISSAIRKLDSRIESILIDRPSSNNQDSEVDTKLDEMARVISQMSERLEREVIAATASPSLAPQSIPTADELDAAVAEIMERQSMLDGTPMRRAPARAAAPAPAPASNHVPQLAQFERQLKTIADEMQSIRKSNAKNAQASGPITELRRDIAELAHSMAELAPRRTLESLEHTVEALTRKIDRSTQNSRQDNRSANAVLTALDEIRVALANVRPAESFISVEGDLNELSEKLDVINAKSIDGTTVARIQNQVQEVRDLLSNALPAENLQAVVAQIETIASKVERISTPDDSGVRGIVGALEQRIDALAERVEMGAHAAQNPEAFDRIHQRLDSLQTTLDKTENPMGLEETMRSVVERLNASEEKLSNLGAIERGISDLSTQFDKARANAMDVAERAAKTALRELRAASQTMPQQIAAAQAAVQSPEADTPAAKPLAGEPPAPRKVMQVMAPSEPQQRFTRVAPVTVQSKDSFVATDGLPADYPLEPGSGAPRSRSTPVQQRIAQSEAAVADLAPRAPDANAKTSDFIAAARRAAQAAAAESPAETTDENKKGALRGIFARSRRAVLLGLVVAMLGFSAVRFFDVSLITNLVSGGTETSVPVPAPAPMQTPPAEQTPAKPESPTFVPESQQRSLVPGFGDPFGPLAPTGDITPQNVVSLFAQPDALTTQSTRQGPRSQQTPLQTQNNAANNQPEKPAADQSAGFSPALLKAANDGDPDAAFEVGERYLTGNGVDANTAEALKWFEKAVAKGSAAAAFRLGMAYEKAQGVTRDRARARTNYVLAADSGHLKAMHNLAVMMVEDGGAKPDYANAIPWFRRAAERGLRDSQYNLGVIYARGFGVSQNLAESFLWFSLAANQGDLDAAKKRDDVATRLDQQTLVASKLAVQTWTAKPSNESVNAPRLKPEWQNAAVAPKKKQKK